MRHLLILIIISFLVPSSPRLSLAGGIDIYWSPAEQGVAQPGRVARLERVGRQFESDHPDHRRHHRRHHHHKIAHHKPAGDPQLAARHRMFLEFERWQEQRSARDIFGYESVKERCKCDGVLENAKTGAYPGQ